MDTDYRSTLVCGCVFVQLTGLKSAQQQVVRSLSAFDGVRYVIPEKRFEGALLWNDDENEQQQDDVEELLELRPQPRRSVAEPSLVGRYNCLRHQWHS